MPTVTSAVEITALVSELVALESEDQRQDRLQELAPRLSHEAQYNLVAALQQEQRALRYSDYVRSIELANLIGFMGTLFGREAFSAAGRLQIVDSQVAAQGAIDDALAQYDEIIAVFQQAGDELSEATAQIIRIWVLFLFGKTDEALERGSWAASVFERHEAWQQLASIRNNMSLIYNRLGDLTAALSMVTAGRAALLASGEAGRQFLPSNGISRGFILANMGRLREANEVTEEAIRLARELGQENAVARGKSNIGRNLFSQGQYNQALILLDEAYQSFIAEGRERDAVLTESVIAECYLELRRFPDVITRVARIQPIFERLQMQLEAGQMLMLAALAQLNLRRREEAIATLASARKQFESAENPFWMAITDLHLATIWLQLGEVEKCLTIARACQQQFSANETPIEAAEAQLLIGHASLQREAFPAAGEAAQEVLSLAGEKDIPQLAYQAYELLGQVATKKAQWFSAVEHFDAAIGALERIQGRLMVEYRADYIADKDALYGQMVALQVKLDAPERALEYAERAKSRALLEMLSQRLDLSLTPRRPQDKALVERLNKTREARDRAYRQLESMYGQGSTPERLAQQETLTTLESEITDLWHRLLRRNAGYGREAALWQVQVESAQPYLQANQAVVEYFAVENQLMAFVIQPERVEVVALTATVAELQSWLQRLQLNLRSVSRTRAERRALAVKNIQGILQKLQQMVMAPLPSLPEQIMVVPHGPLHYLPFAALFDGQHYLLERHELSYLPGASFLKYALEQTNGGEGALVVGHSYSERLPYTIAEAQAIGALVAARPILEQEATIGSVQTAMSAAKLVHLATHGEFRADSPLFSGLALADGWLNTLDVFNTRLRASLVTLSACQTGRNVVSGGDELLGLMRAFLSAGAASLISSHWAVDDRSTAALMRTMYQTLFAGSGKAHALRQAQLELLHDQDGHYQHPYFWAPFYLVGDPGLL